MPKPPNIITRRKAGDAFTAILKTVMDDPSLSWKAKGVLCYLLGKPAFWKVRVPDLVNRGTDGKAAVRAALKELRLAGYMKMERVVGDKGRVSEWQWSVSDSPEFRPDTDFPHLENRHHSKKDRTKKDLSEEAKGSPASASLQAGDAGVEVGSVWIPTKRTKEQQLARLKNPKTFPSEDDFNDFLETVDEGDVINGRPDLYEQLCRSKWRVWKEDSRKWLPIRDWRKFVRGLAIRIQETAQG